MRPIKILVMMLLVIPAFAADVPGQREAQQGLQKVYDAVLDKAGNVDYKKLAEDKDLRQQLEAYVAFAGKTKADDMASKEAKIAFLSNCYNAFTLLGVVRAWPTDSVRDIRPMFGFFTRDEWVVGEQELSLNKLEKKMLRPLDPRIHFTINCASASCPQLMPQVFTTENVNQQMEEATRLFLNDSNKNQFEGDIWRLSKIFDWYQDDWGKRKDVVAFIRSYRKDLKKDPRKVKYLEYDWALNKQ